MSGSPRKNDRRRLGNTTPAGQSTQLIVGASPESDFEILSLAERLYKIQALKRVYYSAYLPVVGADASLPSHSDPPLLRENRLYQADWLIRLYGFDLKEVIDSEAPHLDLTIDPKLAFARRHFESRFADQKWIIYDTSRSYGLSHDCHQTKELQLDSIGLTTFDNIDLSEERLCQTLWQQYFAAINIPQRNNPKLHLRQLPRRYWQYLPEKQS
jgi:hypothetical protein